MNITQKLKHKWENLPNPQGFKDAVQQITLLDVQLTTVPREVRAEVLKLWEDYALGNDNYYVEWFEDDMKSLYPIIAEYLSFRGVVGRCLIHWWW